MSWYGVNCMMMNSLRCTETAISLAYDGVEESMPWQSLVDYLAESTQSFDATLHVFNPRHAQMGYYLVTSNRSSYKRPDWLQLALTLAEDLFPTDRQPRRIEELMSREQFQQSDIYRKVMAPNGLDYVLTQELYRDPELCIRLSMDRQSDQGPFQDADKQLLSGLSTHLIKAMRIRLRQQEQEARIQLFEESLSNMGVGLLSLNARGEIIQSNQRAQQLLQAHSHLQVRNHRLCLDGCRKRFKDVLENALTRDGEEYTAADSPVPRDSTSIRIESLDGRSDLQLVVKPLRQQSVGAITGTAAQLFINEVGGQHREFDPERLQAMFSFTMREARLAVLIAEGCSLSEASERLNVSINTVKTHLRGIYDKLGVRRQARVATILNSTMKAMM